jgi:hypothetical protein
VRSCLIDGEAVTCDENGLAVFDLSGCARVRGYRVEAAGFALPVRPLEGLAQVQEPECAGREAQGRKDWGKGRGR